MVMLSARSCSQGRWLHLRQARCKREICSASGFSCVVQYSRLLGWPTQRIATKCRCRRSRSQLEYRRSVKTVLKKTPDADVCIRTTMEADAKPVSCPMAIQEIEKYHTVWFMTLIDKTAVREMTGGQQDNVTIIEKAFGYRSPALPLSSRMSSRRRRSDPKLPGPSSAIRSLRTST